MDRCALFVDASYALADGAMAVHGTRRRDSVSWNHAGLLTLLAGLAKDRTGLPVLRCYWYEAAAQDRRTAEQDALAEMPGLKLRLVNTRPGRREGIEAQLRRDLVTLARNGAISDAFIASADEHLAEIVSEVQDLGLRVVILHISSDGGWTIPQPLRQECDDIVEISAVHLRPFVELIRGAEPAGISDSYAGYPAVGGPSSAGALPAGAITGNALPAGTDYGQGAQSYAGVGAGHAGRAQASASEAYGNDGAGQAGARQGQAAPQHAQGGSGQPGMAQYDTAGPAAASGSGQLAASSGSAGISQNGAVPDGSPQSAYPGAGTNNGTGRPGMQQGGFQNGHGSEGAAQAGVAPGAGALGGQAGPQGASPYGGQGQNGMPPQNGAARNGVAASYQGPGFQAAGPYGAPPQNGAGQNGAVAQTAGYLNGSGQADAGAGPYQGGPVPNGMAQHLAPQNGAPQNGGYQNGSGQNGAYQNGAHPNGGSPGGAPAPGRPNYESGPMPGQTSFYAAPAPGQFQSQSAGAALQHAQRAGFPPNQAQQSPGQPGQQGPMPQGSMAQGSMPQGPVLQGPVLPGPAPQGGALELASAYPPQAQYAGQAQAAQGPASRAHPVAIALPDAVKAAHSEGFTFGESVGRDAPGLWLEAVLARKPRMPSDLEARLLQGSALPIDSLLHDEVRHSLRRGFWDALESARR